MIVSKDKVSDFIGRHLFRALAIFRIYIIIHWEKSQKWENSIKNGDSKLFIAILYKKNLILRVKPISLTWAWVSLTIIADIL